MQVLPGAREVGPGYCEVCGTRVGRYSDSLGVVLCDDCWRPRFYAPRLPKARTGPRDESGWQVRRRAPTRANEGRVYGKRTARTSASPVSS
jgi:hypothetical protein